MSMQSLRKPLFLFFFLVLSFNLLAQTGSIRGFVYEKKTGEPVIFTSVYLYKSTYGGVTDVNGYFVISQIPPGEYTLMVTSIGYDTLSEKITVDKGAILTKKLYLDKATYVLKGAQVSAQMQEQKKEVKTSVVKITPKQIKQLPTIGGSPDLAQYLQVLPGVIFTGDQGGQLYIRGGSPVQNKVLLDGMIIYNPFHSIGLFSVFDTDILRNADIYTGGFGSEYGGRISSVMDITTRDGNKKRFGGKVGASVFGAKALVEGPLQKQKESGSGSSSFILSVKNSYLQESSKLFYEYVDENGLPFNYQDIYGKVSFNSGSGSKINFFGFNFQDQVNYKAVSNFKWNSTGGGSNFIIVPGKSPALIQGVFAYSKYKMTLEEGDLPPRESSIAGFNAGLNFSYFFKKNELKYGVEMLGFKTDFNFFNSIGRKIEEIQNTTEIAAFIKYKMVFKKLTIDPGFRFQWYASLSNVSPEPRIAMKYNINNNIRLKMSGGLYSQNLISANSDRDVVNLFYGFLSGPENLPKNFDGKTVKHKLQKSEHIVAGFEYDPIPSLTLTLEGYYKHFPQLTNLNRNKIYDDTGEYSDQPDYLKKDFIIESGDARGLDFSAKLDLDRFYFWGVYSFAFVDRYDGIIEYVPHYDRRHNVNLVASVYLGEDKEWEFDARWNFGSGFPLTLTNGYYGRVNFNDGITSNYTSENESLSLIYGEPNGGRLSTYHRLDINIKRKIQFTEESTLEIDLSVTNLYNRENIFYVNRITNERVYQLPILPSLGVNFSF